MKTLTVSELLRMPFREVKNMQTFLVMNGKTKKVLFKVEPFRSKN